tara:strand:+ start:950 stop:1786 length:837 start_codon:yes stop_codon:yes gene_type:complete
MIQGAPPGKRRFISTMKEHLDLCHQFAIAFGNNDFEQPKPLKEFLYIVKNHDRGWDSLDNAPVLDKESGYPSGIGSGPVPNVVTTSKLSPDFNEKHHAYCGLLSSMHSWGLYNDRYGYSQFRVLDGGKSVPVSSGEKNQIADLLQKELKRQERLKKELSDDSATASWVEEKNLTRNYKLLQFFDTLALYFNLRHPDEHTNETFIHVPKTLEEDCEVTIYPLGKNQYQVHPFPFADKELCFRCEGRYFSALVQDNEYDLLADLLYGLPISAQEFVFLAK